MNGYSAILSFSCTSSGSELKASSNFEKSQYRAKSIGSDTLRKLV